MLMRVVTRNYFTEGSSGIPRGYPEILQKRVMEQAEWEILPKAVRMIADGLVKVENEKVRILK